MESSDSTFPDFLIQRFSPCIYCTATDSVKEKYPDWKHIFSNAWKEASKASKINFRLLFPDDLISTSTFHSKIFNRNNYCPNFTSNEFFDHSQPILYGELPTTSYIRKLILESSQIYNYMFMDIPLNIVKVALVGEKCQISLTDIPRWAKADAATGKGSVLRFPADDLIKKVSHFILETLPKHLNDRIINAQKLYNQYYGSWGSFFSDLLDQPSKPTISLLAIKRYADLRLSAGLYSSAIALYEQAISICPSSLKEFLCLCYLLQSFAYIIESRKKSKPIPIKVLDLLKSAISISTNRPISTLIYFTDVWIRTSMKSNSFSLFKYIQTQIPHYTPMTESGSILTEESIFQDLNPFIYEQEASLSKPKYAAFLCYLSAEMYLQVEARELSAFALWKAYSTVNLSNWTLISHQLLARLIQTLDEPKSILFYISDTMRSTHQHFPSYFLKSIKMIMNPSPNTSLYNTIAGFIVVRINKIDAPGFIFSPPANVTDDWFSLAERLFGAYSRGKWFSKDRIKICEAAVGSIVYVSVIISSFCNEFPLSNVKLVFEGSAQAESSTIDLIEIPQIKKAYNYKFTFTPTKAGKLKISGIEFQYGDAFNLKRYFIDILPTFIIHEKVPSINIIAHPVPRNLVIGERTELILEIQNNDLDLDHLSLYMIHKQQNSKKRNSKPISQVVLYDPICDNLLGHYKFPKLKAGESINAKIAINALSSGTFDLKMFFPFWSNDYAPRFSFFSLHFIITEPIGLKCLISPLSTSIQLSSIYTPIGFSSSIFNCDSHTFFDKESNRIELRKMSSKSTFTSGDIPGFATLFENPPERLLDSINVIPENPLSIWLKINESNSFLCYPLSMPIIPITIQVNKNERRNAIDYDHYNLIIKSHNPKIIHDLSLSIFSDDNNIFINGMTFKFIPNFDPGKTYEMQFSLLRFNEKSNAKLLICYQTYSFDFVIP